MATWEDYEIKLSTSRPRRRLVGAPNKGSCFSAGLNGMTCAVACNLSGLTLLKVQSNRDIKAASWVDSLHMINTYITEISRIPVTMIGHPMAESSRQGFILWNGERSFRILLLRSQWHTKSTTERHFCNLLSPQTEMGF